MENEDKRMNTEVKFAQSIWECDVKEIFQKKKPNLILSVLGETNLYLPVAWSRPAFKDAIIETAEKANGCWILCEGTNVSSAHCSLVKDIFDDFKCFREISESEDDSIHATGIDSLFEDVFKDTTDTEIKDEDNRMNVTLFSLQDGIKKQLAVPNDKCKVFSVLLELEKQLKNQHINLNIIGETMNIPVVCIVFEGDLDTIEQVNETMKADIPVVVIKGSGKAADLLADFISNDGDLLTKTAKWFGKHFLKDVEKWNKLQYLKKEIDCRRWLLSIFDIQNHKKSMADTISTIVCSGWSPTKKRDKDYTFTEDFPDLFLHLIYLDLQYRKERGSLNEKLLLLCAWEYNHTDLCQILVDNGATFTKGNDKHKILDRFKERKEIAIQKCKTLVGYSKDTQIREENDDEDDSWLMLSSVLKASPKLTDMSWQKSPHQLMTALIVSAFAEKQAKSKRRTKDKITSSIQMKIAKTFEDRAIYILDKLHEEYTRHSDKEEGVSAQDENDEAVNYLLQKPVNVLSVKSCPLELAYFNERYGFISHTCSQKFLYKYWEGTMEELRVFGIPLSRKAKFWIHYIFFVVALFCFSVFFLTDIRPPTSFSPWHISFTIWIFGDILEEFYTEFFYDKWRGLKHSYKFRLQHWYPDFWNLLDVTSYVLYLAGLFIHIFKPSSKYMMARRFYTGALVLTYVRILRVLLIWKKIGPSVIMIGLMLRDLLRFLPIFMIFALGAGVAYHGNIFRNDEYIVSGEWDSWRMWQVMKIPFWQIFGENPLESFDSSNQEYCMQLQLNATKCDQVDWIVPFSGAIYMLISNLLLVNLVIAMFSNRFNKVQSNSEKYWNYYMVSLITEYRKRLPVPLNLIVRAWRFSKAFFTCCYPFEDDFRDTIKKKEETERELAYFQSKFAAECLRNEYRRNEETEK